MKGNFIEEDTMEENFEDSKNNNYVFGKLNADEKELRAMEWFKALWTDYSDYTQI